MADRNNNVNNTDKTGEVMSWVIVIILMFVFPPLGWIMLLIKLGVFSGRSTSNKSKQNAQIAKTSNSAPGNNSAKSTAITSNTHAVKTEMMNAVSYDKQNKKRRNRLFKKTGKGISVILLLISISLFIAGGSMLVSAIQSIAIFGVSAFTVELGMGIFYLLGGIISFFARNIAPNTFSRYKNYYGIIEGRDIVPLHELAQVAGVSQKTAIKDLQAMINKDFLQIGTYIDHELECLVLSSQAAEKMRNEIMSPDISTSQPENVTEFQYKATLAELREINAFIVDETISERVNRLIELAGKIFRIVEETPQKQTQLRRFTSYYLPTTLKLVRSYATLEKQGEKGENIMSAKKSIRDILDTLSTGFEQQLDQLFKSDAIDIAADINVLENLMKQDGLKEDKLMMQVLEG